jgi:branched-chain amino acid transport system substrate-binding protein
MQRLPKTDIVGTLLHRWTIKEVTIMLLQRSILRLLGSTLTAGALLVGACQAPAGPATTGGGAPAPASPTVKTIVPVQPGPPLNVEVKIGFVSSMTGPINDSSTANLRGFELAIEDWNNAGGFGGRKVVPVVYDDEFQPQRAIELTQRLINVDRVAGIVGYNFGGAALAAIDVAQAAGVPLIVTGSGVGEVTARYAKEPVNYMFGVRMLDRVQARVAFRFMRDKRNVPLNKIAILGDTSGYGQQSTIDGTNALADLGARPCAIETIQPGETDATPQLQRIQAAGCEALILYTFAPETTAILNSARKINSPIKFFGNWGWSQPALYKLAGEELLRGIPFVQSFTVDMSPEARALNERLLERYKESLFPLNSAQGYDGTMLLLRAIAKAQSTDGKKIVEALESTSGYKGVTRINQAPFSKTDHEGLDDDAMYFMGEWKGGVIVTAQ